jgi:hypothetical protein
VISKSDELARLLEHAQHLCTIWSHDREQSRTVASLDQHIDVEMSMYEPGGKYLMLSLLVGVLNGEGTEVLAWTTTRAKLEAVGDPDSLPVFEKPRRAGR